MSPWPAQGGQVFPVRAQSESSAVIAGLLIMALLVGGIPQLSGVVVTGTRDAPAFTLNICHPPPGLNYGSGFSAVPLISGPHIYKPPLSEVARRVSVALATRAREAPDPPPPKLSH